MTHLNALRFIKLAMSCSQTKSQRAPPFVAPLIDRWSFETKMPMAHSFDISVHPRTSYLFAVLESSDNPWSWPHSYNSIRTERFKVMSLDMSGAWI